MINTKMIDPYLIIKLDEIERSKKSKETPQETAERECKEAIRRFIPLERLRTEKAEISAGVAMAKKRIAAKKTDVQLPKTEK